MIPIVNHKYKYILLYSAKVGCSSMRSLYWDMHKDEFDKSEIAALDKYHNLNEVHRYIVGQDYSDYFTYVLTRNPYSRIVSAFLDQYVYLRNTQVRKMLSEFPYEGAQEPQNFIEFLEYLKIIPDGQRDTHFQTQTFTDFADLIVTPADLRFRLTGMKHQHAFAVNYVGDISAFNHHTKAVFKRIFKKDKVKFESAISLLGQTKKRNTSFYGKEDFENAALLSIKELDELNFAPKPQDFYTDQRAIDLVNEIYHDDFKWFKYSKGDIPEKCASKEVDLIPQDLDWQMYIKLSPDLAKHQVYNKRSVIRHYLEFGRFESIPRAYKIIAPEGFDWKKYLNLYPDLGAAGITCENAAIEHYLSYGAREGRSI